MCFLQTYAPPWSQGVQITENPSIVVNVTKIIGCTMTHYTMLLDY